MCERVRERGVGMWNGNRERDTHEHIERIHKMEPRPKKMSKIQSETSNATHTHTHNKKRSQREMQIASDFSNGICSPPSTPPAITDNNSNNTAQQQQCDAIYKRRKGEKGRYRTHTNTHTHTWSERPTHVNWCLYTYRRILTEFNHKDYS